MPPFFIRRAVLISGMTSITFPAEWEKHEATWIGWPHNGRDWPGKLAPVRFAYGEIVRKLSQGEIVRILAQSESHEKSARALLSKAGAEMDRVEFFRVKTDRGWTRDFGPIFVRRGKALTIAEFGFTGWAKYPNHKLDAKAAGTLAKKLKIPAHPALYNGKRVVVEGGAIDSNGRGTLLTTEECLLDQKTQVRNPGFSKRDMEAVFREQLGIGNVLWLGKGIVGDDTHGHVDDLCRFVNATTVVLASEANPGDANYTPLNENRERLQGMRLETGKKIKIVSLPMPAPLVYDGVRLPASYANFYIGNAAVLVPTFNDANDRIALGILAELFTDRPVIGINAVDLVWGFGTLHCLTQQQPTP
jgi:agmatine deiminase